MWREPRCYKCGRLGHLSMQCPSKVLFSEGRSAKRETTNGRSRPLRRSGVVNGKTVADVVLDTGCMRTLVHDRLVPVGQRTKGAIIIRCAHGDEVTYPIAEVEISVSGRVLKVEAGVSRTLPASVPLALSYTLPSTSALTPSPSLPSPNWIHRSSSQLSVTVVYMSRRKLRA